MFTTVKAYKKSKNIPSKNLDYFSHRKIEGSLEKSLFLLANHPLSLIIFTFYRRKLRGNMNVLNHLILTSGFCFM